MKPVGAGRIAAINRFIPPTDAATADALARLGRELMRRNPDLTLAFLGSDRPYGRHAAGKGAGKNAKQGMGRRVAAALADGWRLSRAAAGFPVVLSLTDPPFLPHWLSARLSPHQRWVEWTMDLYPQAIGAALGLIPAAFERNRSNAKETRGMGRAAPLGAEYRRSLIDAVDLTGGFPPLPGLSRIWVGRQPDLRLYLGPAQAAYITQQERRPPPGLILPAGVRLATPCPPPSTGDRRVHLAYAGNHGRAHWDDALPLLAAACDPARFRLTVAAFGAGAPRLQARLAGFPHVTWREDGLSDGEMAAVDIHVVSLRANWTHVCVPSKAVSALCRGRPILFFGSAVSDVWGWADGAGWRIDPERAGALSVLPGVAAAMAADAARHHATALAAKAGDRLRKVEAKTLDVLTDWLVDALSLGALSLNV